MHPDLMPDDRQAGSAMQGGISLMQMLLALALALILAAVAFPVYTRYRTNAHKGAAIQVMKDLGTAAATYAKQNGDQLPAEDVKGKDDWKHAALPEAEGVWYNALPKILGRKSLADFVKESDEAAFYTDANMLHLPGAVYPEKKKFAKPLFAIAMNTKLQRKDRDGRKEPLKISTALKPERTVLFFEQGLPGEARAHPAISKKDQYTGAPKGGAHSFVARYGGKALLAFMDGHVEEAAGDRLLTPIGAIAWDEKWAESNPAAIFWTPDPAQDPNEKK